ncbi:phage tail protein [Lactiplantibacillus argentoratensis]|uniref:beta strand repeat-containing protein n=1 Tax=Lactiplantibacillus argentoratensis TaxID=271881 RepID=UPI001BDBEFA2|nr:phage tail protein [Lactiplantibacillus argentoratensis]MBT1143273.1 phage tail protein [Lactiplantibacillus argentoratensis]MBT1146133.1 phage tail protein [Lactiplantibacillus argentoratensis]MBT1148888.1 phage tail protein [Lactiplantibacillus argentoratensis]MBT1151924.1 phage tail protein [Lactiplantibacillus argentoratensis]
MAESNATQVILTDDGLKIIKAQSTADSAASGVTDLNDPNLMSVIEKQTQAAQYAGLTSQYNVILARAKDASINTADLTIAYTNLNTFMTAILTDTTKASDVDRDTYKILTDAYNSVLSKVQTALSNSFNTDINNMQSSVSVASQAASSAVVVASQAAITGDNAGQMASQAVVIASQAQGAGNNATSIANSASQAASSAVLAGSQATVSANKAITAASQAQSAGNNATSIANNASQAASSAILAGSTATVSANKASADYQTLSAGVKDGSVVHITTETVIDKGVIGTAEIANGAITNAQIGNEAVNSAKIANLAVGTAQIGDGAITNAKIGKLAVGTAQIANGAITNAQIGSLAVDTAQIKDAAINSAKIANLAVGTAQIGDGAITNAKIGKLAVGTAQIANAAITDAQVGNVSANKLTAGTIDFNTITGKNINASNITTGTLATDRLNVDKLSALSANLGNVTTGSLKGVNIVANSFSTPNGSFTTDSNGAVVASNLTIRGVTNLVYNAALLGGAGGSNPSIPGWNLFTKGYYSNLTLHDGVPSIGFNSSTGSGTWVTFAQSKLYPLNGLTGQPYSASVWFIEDGSEAAMNYQFTLAFYDANGNRLNSGIAGNTWKGNPTAQGWAYKTIDNIVSPSTAVYVGIQYFAYNGKGHALFSSPMLTQTAQANGYQPDTGNVVSAGEIDGSIINGSTINGTTFHGGDIINDANNTSQFYPTTIASNGHIYTTGFNSADAMQTDLSTGSLTTKYRATNSSGNQYEAYDTKIDANQITLFAGHTNGKDMSFSQSVTGYNQDGYVLISPLNGMTLHGDNQQITFNGTSDDVTPKGVIITPYGNINPNGTQNIWYVGNNMNMKTASFGMDGSGTYGIQFNRSLDIGNFNINTYHTITSSDNGPIHFNRNDGNPVDIYADAVHYNSLTKSSLLSLKKDIKKADTAYWAQLVNSIDLATYQYKTDDNTSHIRLSSIVDDVNDTKQWQLPDVFISRDENGKLNGVDDSVLLNATLATVQEQQKQIDQLNGHNMQLEARLNKLEAKLNG